MYTASVKTDKNERLMLTGNPKFDVLEITGLEPTQAIINTTTIASYDGEKINNARLSKRNIVIKLKLNPPLDENRHYLYKYIKSKHYIKFFFENDNRSVYTEGIVENVECDMFVQKETAQISIICGDAYFKTLEENTIDFNTVVPNFEFPFSIDKEGVEMSHIIKNITKTVNNMGDTENGVIMTLTATGTVQNPLVYNVETKERFAINYTMKAGDKIVINTNKGEKSIYNYRGGEKINIINFVTKYSKWLSMHIGENIISLDCQNGSEFLQLNITHINKFQGV